MTNTWPSFETHDLGPDDDSELMLRWEAYDREMKALIATGRFHQDDDGWWVETTTGKLVGPDPEIERPLSSSETAKMVPFSEAFPDLAGAIKRSSLPDREQDRRRRAFEAAEHSLRLAGLTLSPLAKQLAEELFAGRISSDEYHQKLNEAD